MVLRNVHTVLTEDYQLPYWVSYVAFAVATVLLGGLLGLFLVCCIDCVYPPRREDSEPMRREDKKDSDVEEDDDDAEGSQYEGEETQEEDLSQDEEDDLSQDEEEQLSQEEEPEANMWESKWGVEDGTQEDQETLGNIITAE